MNLSPKTDYRLLYVIMCFLIPGTEAFINSTTAVYLSTELNFNAQKIATYFVLYPISYVLIVQIIAKISDLGIARSKLILTACIAGLIANFIFITRPNQYTMFFMLIPCYAVAQSAYSQIFAASREYAVLNLPSSIKFITFLRSLASLAWVIIPSFAFYLIANGSFSLVYIFCFLTYLIIGLLAVFLMPDLKIKENNESNEKESILKNKNVMLLCLSITAIFTAFSSYYNTMPLFLIKQLRLDNQLPGTMFSISAFFEIPLMLCCPFLAKKIGLKAVISIGCIALTSFMFLLQFVTESYQILCMAILPAIFIASVCSMGMVYFQELLFKIPGQATSLFFVSMNSGYILGGFLISIATDDHYTNVYATGSSIALFAIILLMFVKKPQHLY